MHVHTHMCTHVYHTFSISKKMVNLLAGNTEALYMYIREAETNFPGVRLCPDLCREHTWLTPYSKMKMNLAAQV